jgi:hypothetical protein
MNTLHETHMHFSRHVKYMLIFIGMNTFQTKVAKQNNTSTLCPMHIPSNIIKQKEAYAP